LLRHYALRREPQVTLRHFSTGSTATNREAETRREAALEKFKDRFLSDAESPAQSVEPVDDRSFETALPERDGIRHVKAGLTFTV